MRPGMFEPGGMKTSTNVKNQVRRQSWQRRSRSMDWAASGEQS
jgi:hypothetical protein